jgi:hypothetical protein
VDWVSAPEPIVVHGGIPKLVEAPQIIMLRPSLVILQKSIHMFFVE